MGHKCDHMYTYRKEARGRLNTVHTERRWSKDGSERARQSCWPWRAMNQRKSTATRRWKRQGTNFLLKHPEKVWSFRHLGFSLVRLILDFLVSRTVRQCISVVLSLYSQETNTLAFNIFNPWWLEVIKSWYSKSAINLSLIIVKVEVKLTFGADYFSVLLFKGISLGILH